MKRISILSLVILLLFAVQFAFADNGGEEPLPPNYSFNRSIRLEWLANSNIPAPVEISIPASYWDSHEGYLMAQSSTWGNNQNIGTIGYVEFQDGSATNTVTVSKVGHTGRNYAPINTAGIDSGSFFRCTMYQAGSLAYGATSIVTINIHHVADLDF